MNLIIIYGPPAAGKLTVAKALAKVTNYTLIDNHQATDYLPALFPRSVPKYEGVRSELGRKIRLILFEAAAKNNIDLITTFAPLHKGAQGFIRNIQNVVEKNHGKVLLVQLLPSMQTLEERIISESRIGHKADSTERLHELLEQFPEVFDTFPNQEHLVIDNSHLTPEEVVQRIVSYYKLFE